MLGDHNHPVHRPRAYLAGKIAHKRGLPQAETVEILSLLGLLMFPLWMAALAWAYVKRFRVPVAVEEFGSRGLTAIYTSKAADVFRLLRKIEIQPERILNYLYNLF